MCTATFVRKSRYNTMKRYNNNMYSMIGKINKYYPPHTKMPDRRTSWTYTIQTRGRGYSISQDVALFFEETEGQPAYFSKLGGTVKSINQSGGITEIEWKDTNGQ